MNSFPESRPSAIELLPWKLRCSALLLTLPWALPVSAQEPAAPDLQQAAYQQTVAQESVRKQADKIQGQLVALIETLKLNGLNPSQISSLTTASGHLSSLSQEEMQKIINALQSASIAGDDSTRKNSLVTAYQGQQDLVLKLKELSARIAAQQLSEGLVAQLENLIARQTGNLRHTTELAAAPAGSGEMLPKMVAAEQAGIGGEISFLLTTLPTAIGASPATPEVEGVSNVGASAKAALEAANGTALKPDSAEATRLTGNGTFGEAVGKETLVRDELAVVLKAAMAHQDAATQLAQAKTQLDQVEADQKNVADATKDGKLDKAALAERQAQINDRAEVAKALLKPLQPAAADQVKAAQDAIKQSADALGKDGKSDDAMAKQDQVAKALAAAQDLLTKQIADVNKQQNQSPVDQVAQIQKAQDEIKAAQSLAATNAPEAAKAAQQAQKDALASSPEAASKAGQAADQLQQPQPDAAAANKALADANDALQKQKDAMAQTAQDFAALSQASQSLAAAQQSASSADQSMQKSDTASLSQAAHAMSQAQSALAQSQAQAGQSNTPQDAKDAMQQAGDALKNATNQAVQAKGADAKSQNGKAMAAMQKAQDSLGKAMASLAGKGPGGAPSGPGSAGKADGESKGSSPGSNGTVTDSQAPISGTTKSSGYASLKGDGLSTGTAVVVGNLSPKDRDAISQYQAEKAPPAYAPMVQQYLKNLADADQAP